MTLVDDPSVKRALLALVVFEVVQRMARYALAKPSREVLFTVVGREVKYQAKPVIDTVVYRGGDVTSAWSYSILYRSLGLSLAAVCFAAVPVAVTRG
jgi:AAA family ATP:ADP antiporter